VAEDQQRKRTVPPHSNTGEEPRLSSEKAPHRTQEVGTPDRVGEIADQSGALVAVAQIRNAADAAYFAERLIREAHIEAEVRGRELLGSEQGVAVAGNVLLVPTADAENAARILQAFLESTSDDAVDPLPETITVDFGLCEFARLTHRGIHSVSGRRRTSWKWSDLTELRIYRFHHDDYEPRAVEVDFPNRTFNFSTTSSPILTEHLCALLARFIAKHATDAPVVEIAYSGPPTTCREIEIREALVYSNQRHRTQLQGNMACVAVLFVLAGIERLMSFQLAAMLCGLFFCACIGAIQYFGSRRIATDLAEFVKWREVLEDENPGAYTPGSPD
jgi:hypothetical protein